jgi:hypothetical protein
MFKTLTDTSKAAIFTALVLILAVAAALAINALGLASNEFAWGPVWSITPVLATLIMLLVVAREGNSRKGWQSLGLGRLGLRLWWIAFFGTLAITVAATAAVWATPLASVTAPAGGIINSAVKLAIQVLLLATAFSLAKEIGLNAGVVSLLRGEAPPHVPMPHHPLLASATLVIAVVTTVLMFAGMAWTMVTLRRWRTHPDPRPGRPRALGLRVGLSSAIHLGWGLSLLVIFPALAYPLAPTLLIVPDLGYLIVISSVVAMVWGIARPPLNYFTLRRRDDWSR